MELTVMGLLMGASLPVQIVMLLLVGASIVSWSIIFTKRRLIRRTKDTSDEFEAAFAPYFEPLRLATDRHFGFHVMEVKK